MNVLAINIGNQHQEPRKSPSGPTLSPRQMGDGVKKFAADWKYDVVGNRNVEAKP